MTNFINQFPYMDGHELNLDWIIKEVKRITSEMKEFKAVNEVTFIGAWNIANNYAAWNIVTYQGFAYISSKPVPSGIALDNTDYWILIGPVTVDQEARRDIIDINNEIDSMNEEISGIKTRSDQIPYINSKLEALSGDLETEINVRADADTVINARIDEIIALPEGSTQGDAELMDIRVGANGKTYDSAGDAVRAQYDIVEDSLADYVGVKSGYLFNERQYIGTAGDIGTEVNLTPSSNNALDYIVVDCKQGDIFYVTGNGAGGARLGAFIDEDNILLWHSVNNASWSNQRVNAPAHASKFIMNARRDSTYSLVKIEYDSPLFNSVLSSSNITINSENYEELLISDADNLKANTVYGIASNITEDMVANLPDYGAAALIYSVAAITPAEANPSGVVTIQFFVRTDALKYYYRIKAGDSWSAWYSVINNDNYDLSSYFVNTCVQKPVTIDSTKRVILFGDSIATGTGSDDMSDPHYWLKDLATMTGCSWTTYGVGSSAFTDTGDPAQRGGQVITAINDPGVDWDCDIVFVAAGTNDAGFGYKLDEETVLNALETDVTACITAIRNNLALAGRSDAKIIFITPIRRGGTTVKKIAIRAFLPKVCSKIANTCLLNGISIINGFDFPITVENTEYYDAMTNYDELHPNNIGKTVYAMSVLNAVL